MITKTFEVRDSGTFIPVLAVKLEPGCEADRYLFGRAGYGTHPGQQAAYVLLCRIVGEHNHGCEYDPEAWWRTGARTLVVAHRHIVEHFDELPSGAVVCVEHILGERSEPKRSEREVG